MHYVSKLLDHVIGKSVLGRLNRIGGIIFGMAKMAFIISVFIVIVQKIDKNQKLLTHHATSQSKLFSPIASIAPAIFPHLHLNEMKNGLLGR
jgi:membrane protein required for colicin V production